MPPVLVAPDSFKGTLRATQVAAAIGRGLESAGLEPPDLCPVADGGEGTLEALLTALGGATEGTVAHDPFGREIRSGFALVEGGGTAVVETAEASGLHHGQDPWPASTYGTGEVICAAVRAGAQVVLVGVGGSATTDGGAGALEAIEAFGGLHGARLVVLCDVRTTWERCAEVFAPQKGADAAMVARLGRRLDELADSLPRDPRGVAMTGAAGGLAGGLWAVHDAVLEPGASFVLDALDFTRRMRPARCVITGEGRLDEQSLQGKVIGEIGTRTRQGGVPLHAIVGRNAMDPFAARMIDLQEVTEASTPEEIEAAARALGARIGAGLA
ncbi:MAG: glycerate kinase [Solirubrobacteraceae bacterium]